MMKLLVINPGSTSTKIGVFEDDTAVLVETLRHSAAEVGVFAKIVDQFEFRKAAIIDVLERDAVDPSSLDAVVGRGGLLRPLPSGTYAVNAAMIAEVMP
ncbi:MAG: butyrate kinase, partial [Clostridia bacterium]|nr:butyrate kinase [Clostridia bacterium]